MTYAMRLIASSSLCAMTAAMAPTAASAQQPAEATPPVAQLEEIVVTARRQAERLQSTPVSVSALSSSMLDSMNIRGVDDVAQLVPNVSLVEASGGIAGNVAFIRGIGSQEPLLTIDSPVGIYLDGIYLGRQAANNFDLVDPERVEVLRGPQGTLFGRNTTGGAINIITQRPADELGGEVKTGYSSFDHWYGRAILDTGAWGGSGLSATLSFLHRERDGFVDNPNTPDDRDPGALRSTAAWGKISGEWGDFNLDLTADWNDQKGQRNPFQIVRAYEPAGTYYSRSPSFGGDAFITGADRIKTLPFEYLGQQSAETFGFAATAQYALSPAFTLKSISGWRGWDSQQPTNYAGVLRGPVVDFTSPTLFSVQRVSPFVAYEQDLRQRQFSQEFQILGKTDTLSYVAGAYYFNERASEFNTNNFTIVLPPAFLAGLGFPSVVGDALTAQGLDLVGVNLGQTLAYSTKSESIAGFGQISWKPEALDQKLEVTGGVRYTHDKRSIDQASVPTAQPFAGQLPNPGPTPGPARAAKADFDNWSFLASVNYQWTPDIMTYARFSTGYKSGGFDARAGVDLATGATFPFTFEPEKATSYEIGFKTEFANRTVRVNGAAFYTEYDNLQIPQYSGGNGFVPNGNAHYQGFELEALALPFEQLQIDASLGYVDPVYDELLLVDPATGIEDDYSDVAKFPYVPKWTVHVGAQYSIPLDWATILVRSDYSYTSRRYFFTATLLNPLNDVIADPGQDLLSARISLTDIALGATSTLEVSLFGENLLKDDRRLAGIDFGPSLGIAGVNLGEPRRFGVDVTLKF